MSNMSKTIAILGVVAGLGVTALPLSTYAAPENGNVEWAAPTIPDPENEGQTIPNPNYSDELMGGEGDQAWVKSDTTISLLINDKLSISTSKNDVELVDSDDSGLYTAEAMKVTVTTKNSGGYKLTMHGSAVSAAEGSSVTSNALTNEKGDEFTSIATANATLGSGEWGYKKAELSDAITAIDSAAPWNPIATSKDATNAVLRSSSSATIDTGESVLVQFGAQAATNQAAGTYNGKVTFTATNQVKTEVTEP